MTMTIISNQKVDMVKQPPHYTYGDIEIIDFIEQVTAQYPPELAFAIGSAIKYIARANHKNGKEDIDKARWYLQRVFDKWDTTINQRYRYNTKGKMPTQINRELREKGVQGFVIKLGSNKVVMKVLEEHKHSNRECMR